MRRWFFDAVYGYMQLFFGRYYVYVHHGEGRMDVWRWNGRRQKLLFRNNTPADVQPPLSDNGVPYRGRLFFLEKGAEFFEVLFVPVANGLLRHVPD